MFVCFIKTHHLFFRAPQRKVPSQQLSFLKNFSFSPSLFPNFFPFFQRSPPPLFSTAEITSVWGVAGHLACAVGKERRKIVVLDFLPNKNKLSGANEVPSFSFFLSFFSSFLVLFFSSFLLFFFSSFLLFFSSSFLLFLLSFFQPSLSHQP